jgi:hypothetical protein
VPSLGEFIQNLARPPEEIRAENLRKLEKRKRQKVAGVIQNIRIDPREGHGSIEATIIDGTGQMVVKWLGRPSKSGIRLGMGLVVEGAVGRASDGEPMVLNPEYELVPGPEHG